MDLPSAPVTHPGSRQAPSPPHIARSFRALQRQVDDLQWQVPPQELHPVPAAVSTGQPCTAAAMADVYRMWCYRNGAAVYADIAAGCGASSVIAVQLACADFSAAGTAVTSAAGGEQVIRVQLDLPDAWQPGEAHYVTVQAYRASGADATTIQVLRGWQR